MSFGFASMMADHERLETLAKQSENDRPKAPRPTTAARGCYRFHSAELAQSFANRCEKPMSVVLGDDDMWWVVTRAMGESLRKDGWILA